MDSIFRETKLKPLIKFNEFKYIGNHDNFGYINYYVRKYDKHNNYEFMEAKIDKLPKRKVRKYALSSGTSIKVIDSFMYNYLKHRKDPNVLNKKFIEKTIEESDLNKILLDYYSTRVPVEIKETDYYKKAKKDGFKVLYCMNNETSDKEFANVYLVMVKDEKQEWIGEDISYVNFKVAEFTVKPSYVKAKGKSKSKDKYFMLELPSINIPTSILK